MRIVIGIRVSLVATAALIASSSLGGLSYLLGKLALADLPVAHVVLYRFTIASLVLLPVLLWQRVIPRRADLPRFVLVGLLNVPVTFLIQFAGLQRTSAASAALLIGTLPLLLALGAVLMHGERLTTGGWLALGLSCVGVALVVGRSPSGGSWLGNSLVLLSLVVVVIWILLAKDLGQHYGPVVTTTYLFLAGTLALWPIALLWAGPPRLLSSPTGWLWVVLLGVGCSALGNVLWHWGLRHVATSQASVTLNIEPLVGSLAAIVVLGERLPATALLGGLLILGSATLIMQPGRVRAKQRALQE